jgi:hypothetical protein
MSQSVTAAAEQRSDEQHQTYDPRDSNTEKDFLAMLRNSLHRSPDNQVRDRHSHDREPPN